MKQLSNAGLWLIWNQLCLSLPNTRDFTHVILPEPRVRILYNLIRSGRKVGGTCPLLKSTSICVFLFYFIFFAA